MTTATQPPCLCESDPSREELLERAEGSSLTPTRLLLEGFGAWFPVPSIDDLADPDVAR